MRRADARPTFSEEIKWNGNEYELIGIARHSETMEPMVVYRALYGERGLWVRPAGMWTEHVERDGYSGPRFQYIGPEIFIKP